MSIVVPAVLPSSRGDLEEKLALFASLPISRVQIDMVDGRFARPASWPCTAPAELAELVAKGFMLPAPERIAYEIDLMCFDPLSAAGPWLSIGASRLIFHTESVPDTPKLITAVRTRFGNVFELGLALDAATNKETIASVISDIDFVQLMGIEKIGVQGQPFDERVFERIRAFRARYPEMPLQVDGGVSMKNAKRLAAAGVRTLVVGSAILKAPNPAKAVRELEQT